MRPRKVGHVVLKVRDLPKAEAFYTEALGFEVVTRFDRPRGVFLSLGEQHHDLALFEVSAIAPRSAGGAGGPPPFRAAGRER